MSTANGLTELKKARGGLAAVPGFRSGAVACGIKPSGKPDLALIVADADCVMAGAFTKNSMAAAPVLWSRKQLRRATQRAIVINSGNANCATGSAGMDNCVAMAEHTAAAIGCDPRDVLVCSTGVIGVPLPMDAVAAGIADCAGRLDKPPATAADGILTTDLVSKEVAYQHADGYRLAGISKGSGMIHPNMATMLGFVCTDVKIDKTDLTAITKRAVARSFNRISVDNDESTNDTCIVLASGVGPRIRGAKKLAAFEAALTQVMQELAQKIVRDGEGATQFIEVLVQGARSEKQADIVAGAVCDSMLVKTAFAGRDPNWGRIAAAAGYSGQKFDQNAITITLNDYVLFSEGSGHDDKLRPFTKNGRKAKRAAIEKSMAKGDQQVVIDLNQGTASAARWTSDLTHGYITINAEYTT